MESKGLGLVKGTTQKGVFPIEWQLSCSDGVGFLRLVSDQSDRRAKEQKVSAR